MKKWFGLFVFVFGYLLSAAVGAQNQAGAQAPQPEQRRLRPTEEREKKEQPGAQQGGVTTSEFDATPKFNMDYFVGEWKFEANLAESPLGEGGPISGTEVVRNVWDGRFWDITIKGDAPEGPFTGKGLILYQDSFSGQTYTRYEVTRGIALLKTGILGCDLGGTCNMHFETPPFLAKGSTVQLRGRFYLTSPFSYRMTTEISVDKGPYRNMGTALYVKNESVKPDPIR